MRSSRSAPFVLPPIVAVLAALPTLSCEPLLELHGEPVRSLAITEVNVIPMDVPGVVPDQTVLVEDGVIVRVGPASDVAVPPDARIIDGRGQYLLPGFADMHVHLGSQASLDLLLAHGITVARDMFGRPSFLSWPEEILEGRRSGPRLVVASPIFEGTPPPDKADVILTERRIIVDDSASAADSVANQVTQGYDLIKVYNNLPAAAYRGILTAASRRGIPVVGHVPFEVGLRGVFEGGQSTIEHLRGYVFESIPAAAPDQPGADFRSRLVAWRHADTAMLRSLAEETARVEIWNVPTLATYLDLLPAARMHELTDRPGWRQCMRGARADRIKTRARVPYFAVMSDLDFAATQEGVAVQRRLVDMLHEAGAGILVGTDRSPKGFSFHWEMEQLVEAGLGPWEVLRAATLDAARYLGQDDRYGSVSETKNAELVLLGANPIEDIRNTKNISAVYAGGRLIEAEELAAIKMSACDAINN